jgi:hypothetical protein
MVIKRFFLLLKTDTPISEEDNCCRNLAVFFNSVGLKLSL